MNEIEQAKLLAAALKLARKEIDKVRVEFEEQLLEFVRTGLVESLDPIQGPPGPKGDKGDPGPERRIIIEHKGPKGDTGDEGRSVVSAFIEENNLYIRFSDEEVAHIGEIATLQGEQGIQGIQGERGEKGDTGDKGDRGEKGEKGDKGDKGDRGDKGDKGDRGKQGIQGEQGIQGDNGAQGEKGEKGEKGDPGQPGPMGAQGPKGEKGDKGDTGEQGEQGPVGPKGDPGKNAEEVDIEAITKELKEDLEKFKAVINAEINSKKTQAIFSGSGGSGEVRLEFLDDVDRDSAKINGRVLQYNSTTGKFEGVVVSGVGGATGDVSNTYLQATFVSNTDFQAFVANTNAYIAATVGTGEVSNAYLTSTFVANTDVQKYLEVSNANLTFVSNAYLQTTFVSNSNFQSYVSNTNIRLTTLESSGGSSTSAPSEVLALNLTKSANVVANDAYVAIALDNFGHEIPADVSNSAHVSRVVGLKVANGDVVTTGIIENSGWSWTSNDTIYVGTATTPPGANNLTTLASAPSAFFSVPVGIALAPTKIFVRVGTSVILGS